MAPIRCILTLLVVGPTGAGTFDDVELQLGVAKPIPHVVGHSTEDFGDDGSV